MSQNLVKKPSSVISGILLLIAISSCQNVTQPTSNSKELSSITNNNNKSIEELKENKFTFSTKGNSDSYYEIINIRSGKCLEVEAGNIYNNGAKVQQWTCNNSDQQAWSFNNGIIINKKSGKVLDLDGGNSKNGTKIQQWDYTGALWQKWQLYGNSLDYVVIGNNNTGKVVDVDGGLTSNGTKVHEWDYYSGLNSQAWKVRAITPVQQNQNPEMGLDNQKTTNGDIEVSGWATDDKRVNRVEVAINGSLIASIPANGGRGDSKNGFGYKTKFNSKNYPNGQVKVESTVYDDEGGWRKLTTSWTINQAPEGYLDLPSQSNQSVSGSINVQGWAVDDKKINRVDIFVNGSKVGTASYGNSTNTGTINKRGDVANYIRSKYTNYPDATYSGFSYQLDTTKYPNGQISVTAKAYDDNGVEVDLTGGNPRILNVYNAPQNRSPEGYLDLPAKPTTVAYPQVSGSLNVQGWAVDDKKINRVDIFVNDSKVGTALYGNQTDSKMNKRPDVADHIRKKYSNYPDATYSGFTYQLDTTKYPNGQIRIKAKAYDDSGLEVDLTGDSSRIVYVYNAPKKPREIDFIYVNGINTDSGVGVTNEQKYLNDALLDTGEYTNLKNSNVCYGGFFDDIGVVNAQVIKNIQYGNNMYIKGVYNPTSKLPKIDVIATGDLIEAGVQKCNQGAWRSYKNSVLWNTWFNYGTLNLTGIALSSAQQKNIDNTQRIIDGIKLGIENSLMVDNRNVVLIPHSQGNFFVNEAIDELLSGNFKIDNSNSMLTYSTLSKLLTKDVLSKSVAIVGLGSPNRVFRSEIPNTYYVSNLYDPVTLLDGINPRATSWNVSSINKMLSKYYCSNGQSTDTTTNIFSDINGINTTYGTPTLTNFNYHYLSSAYLGNSITKNKVINAVNSAISGLRKY